MPNRVDTSRTPSDLLQAEHWLLQGAGVGKRISVPAQSETKLPIRGGALPNSLPSRARGHSLDRNHPLHLSSPPLVAHHASAPIHVAIPMKRTTSNPSSRGASKGVTTNVEPKPIPKVYVYYIRKAYGATQDINLCTDILELPYQSTAYSQAQLRVAYFRKGRSVLQQQSSSPTSVAVLSHTVTSKQRFQAVTKAYEILTHPGYKAYYDLYGLPMLPSSKVDSDRHQLPTLQPQPPQDNAKENRNDFEEDDEEVEEEDDDTVSVASSSASGGSILRRPPTRSRSWGPSSRVCGSQRVVWKEVVQELVYQPDPPTTTSTEEPSMAEAMSSCSSKWSRKKHPCRVKEEFQQVEERDFLDDFEASVKEIGTTIENFVKYLSDDESSTKDKVTPSKSTDKGNTSTNQDTKQQNRAPDPEGICCDHRSSVARQLFPESMEKPLTAPQSLERPASGKGGAYKKRIADRRRCHSNDTEHFPTTAPLKQGKVDRLPRIKPKKSKHNKKLGVDRVPSSFEDTEVIETFDPFQNSFDGSVERKTIKELAESWCALGNSNNSNLAESWSALGNSNNSNFVSKEISVSAPLNQKADPYALPEESSILETSVASDDRKKANLEFIASKALSFDDALNRTTDATTKGFLRLDRHADDGLKSPSAAIPKEVPLLDLSGITFSSTVSDDPVGRHVHGFMTGFAQSAKTTIREIASFDEEGDETRTDKEIEGNTNKSSSDNDVPFFSKFNGYMQLLVEDMSKVGTQMSTNLQEAGRVVRESIALPEADVAGVLRVIEKEFQWTESDPPSEDIHQSFTY
jgi:curved DNA-binding protein CbpA